MSVMRDLLHQYNTTKGPTYRNAMVWIVFAALIIWCGGLFLILNFT